VCERESESKIRRGERDNERAREKLIESNKIKKAIS
jgi:hypothetical protein